MWIALLVLAALVVGVLALAATKPATFRVERATHVAAPPEAVFSLIDDFRRWRAWSPWENLDPELRRTYAGPDHGVGAAYAWEGNRNVGAGRMEIRESAPPSRIAIQLDFLRPFEAHNVATFTLTPEGGGTRVHWAMEGPSLFVGRVMSVFMDMDRMVGRDFEKGLAAMKEAAETAPGASLSSGAAGRVDSASARST